MAINPLYIPLFNIEEVILDKDTGLPLSAGIVKFYRDSQRLTPKPVYQIAGVSPNYSFASVGAVLTLGLSGTFVDQNGDPFVPYAYPYDAEGELDLYYVTVESEGGVAQFVRQAVPYVNSGNISPSERTSTENELSNPQFVEFNFPAGINTVNVTGSNKVTSIAPDWDLITSGSGTVEIQRLLLTSASVPTNPPYSLRIQASSGLGATVTLRQRLNNTVSIFRGGFASGSLTAAVIGGGSSFVTMTYAPSSGISTEIIPSTSILTDGAYHIIQNNAAIPDQANPSADTGYIDINITIPTSRNIAITSIQAVGTEFSIDIPFDEQTVARQKDHLFHYYENSILKQPKENILTGWNFALNPWQFTTTTITNVATNQYTADQTIIVQQNYVNTASGNNVSVGRATAAGNYAFSVNAVTVTNQFAMIQYIDTKTAAPYWGKNLSALVTALIATSHSTSLNFKMKLIYRTTAPVPTISQSEPVDSWAILGEPVLAAGWTSISAVNDPIYTITSSENSFSFDKFTLPAASTDNMILGVMIYTTSQMDSSGTADIALFKDVSLVFNDFAIKSAVETFDQTLRKCQFYYEKSYDQGVLPGTVTYKGIRSSFCQQVFDSGTGSLGTVPSVFYLEYQQIKRASLPTVHYYSPAAGTIDNVSVGYLPGGAAPPVLVQTSISYPSFWTTIFSGSQDTNSSQGQLNYPINTNFIAALSHAGDARTQSITFYHYTADARLGV